MENVKKTNWKLFALRAVLTVLCVLVYVWIFSNSLKTGEQSSSQSQAVTDAVQDAVGTIVPESSIATATGEDYQKLHSSIRTLAHFSEFMLLGFLLTCCYFSYTTKKKFLFIPAGMILLTPFVDEYLQSFTKDRVMAFFDILVDALGGMLGFLIAIALVWTVFYIYRKRQKKGACDAGELGNCTH